MPIARKLRLPVRGCECQPQGRGGGSCARHPLAEDVGCGARTVRRARVALRSCGLVVWVQRLVRDGWRAAQTSNAYRLTLGDPPKIPVPRCGGQSDRETPKKDLFPVGQPPATATPEERQKARAELTQIAAQREPSIKATLLANRRCSGAQ